jgi:DNA repair exonuclease SbcCD nuclease subunit
MLHAADYRTAAEEALSWVRNGFYGNLKVDHQVLVTHGLATTIRDKRLSTCAEFELTPDILLDSYDYIALGHYHGQQQIAANAWYSGSIEHLTYGEIKDMKGALNVDLDDKTVETFPLQSSLMEDLGTIIADGRPMDDITDEIQFRARNLLGYDAMLQVTIDFGSDPVQAIPAGALKNLRDDLLDLKIRVRSKETERHVIQQQDLQAIDYVREFGTFLQHRQLNDTQRAAVEARGTETLKAVIADHTEVCE